jgi:hypothetical protein
VGREGEIEIWDGLTLGEMMMDYIRAKGEIEIWDGLTLEIYVDH